MGAAAAAAAIGAAGAIGGAVISSQASGAASKAQQSSDNAAIAQQQAQLQQEQTQLGQDQLNQEPYLETGSGALAQLSRLYGINTPQVAGLNGANNASAIGTKANQGTPGGAFTNAAGGASGVNPNASFYLSPDYNFTLTQGLKGLTAAGAATNGTDNGAQQKAEIQYAGNLASSQYGTYVNNLMNLAGIGAGAASSTNNAANATLGTAAGTSNSISSADQTAGSNKAAATLGNGQIAGNTVNNLANLGGSFVSSYLQPSAGYNSSDAAQGPNIYNAAVGTPIASSYGQSGGHF